MSYLVLECHLSYAVVLDEEGRILKAANMQYEVGQTVNEIMEMQSPIIPFYRRKWFRSGIVAAACLLMMVSPVLRFIYTPHASVYMTINPSVRVDVNRWDTVVDLVGVNEDGDDLIYNYQYENKKLERVMNDLVQHAIEKNYLQAGGKVTLKLDTEDQRWIEEHDDELEAYLDRMIEEKIPAVVTVLEETIQETIVPPETLQEETPTAPPETQPTEKEAPAINDGDTDYDDYEDDDDDHEDDDDYGDGMTDYDD